MALGLIEDTTLTGIADAIRAKTGKSDLIPTSQMSSEIASIPEPTPPPVIQELNVTQNGTYEVPEGVDGYNPVVVNVSGEPEPPDDGKTRLYITIPANSMEGLPPPRNQVPLYIQQTVENGVTIDWGDGTPTETLLGTGNVNTTHTYEQAGDYVISLDPADGCELGFGTGTSSYCVTHVNTYLDSEWDYVITVCGGANESCPAFIGKVGKRLHIGFDDPSHVTGSEEFINSEFRRVRDEIKNGFARFYITEIKKQELPKCSCGGKC